MDSTDRTGVEVSPVIPFTAPEPKRPLVDVELPVLGPGVVRFRVFPPGAARAGNAPPGSEVRECHGGFVVVVTSAGRPS